MSLSLDSEVLPGDSVPALGNLHVVISLKTNSSQANLTIKSCCISPSPQLDKLNATCSLFTSSGNRISFGPVLKGNEESTVADRTDTDNTSRSTLILGSGLGCLLLVGALLLLWLGYQHKKRRWACLQHNDQGGQTMWSHWV
ncbi:tetratricopeptide repeat protein 12-like [Arapaima gigas]